VPYFFALKQAFPGDIISVLPENHLSGTFQWAIIPVSGSVIALSRAGEIKWHKKSQTGCLGEFAVSTEGRIRPGENKTDQISQLQHQLRLSKQRLAQVTQQKDNLSGTCGDQADYIAHLHQQLEQANQKRTQIAQQRDNLSGTCGDQADYITQLSEQLQRLTEKQSQTEGALSLAQQAIEDLKAEKVNADQHETDTIIHLREQLDDITQRLGNGNNENRKLTKACSLHTSHINELSQELKTLQGQKQAQAEEAQTQRQQDIQNLKEEKTRANQHEKTIQQLNESLDESQSTIQSLRETIDTQQRNESDTASELQNQLDDTTQQLDNANINNQKLTKACALHACHTDELSSELQSLQGEKLLADNALKQTYQQNSELDNRLSEIIAELESASVKLRQSRNNESQLQNQIEGLKQQLAESGNMLANTNKQLEESNQTRQAKATQLAEAKNQLDNLHQDQAQSNQEIETLQQHLSQAQIEIDHLEKQQDAIDLMIAETLETKKQFLELEQTTERLRGQLNQADEHEQILIKQDHELAVLRKEISATELKNESLEKQLTESTLEIEQLTKQFSDQAAEQNPELFQQLDTSEKPKMAPSPMQKTQKSISQLRQELDHQRLGLNNPDSKQKRKSLQSKLNILGGSSSN
jgi:chromosome segregation ATPase